jgi:hypothetical protein
MEKHLFGLHFLTYGNVYLNLKININICVINNQGKFEMYTRRKPSDLFFENYRGFDS